jgi:hypothetical protein
MKTARKSVAIDRKAAQLVQENTHLKERRSGWHSAGMPEQTVDEPICDGHKFNGNSFVRGLNLLKRENTL